MQIALVLFLLSLAVVFFILEIISVDLVALLLMIAFVMFRILTPEEAFAGLSNDVIIFFGGLFVLTAGLLRTGVINYMGQRIIRFGGTNPWRLLGVMMFLVAGVSSFLSNLATVAIFLPIALGASQKARIHESKLLIPVAYASILGGTCTLVGTSTNIIMNGIIQKYDLPPFSLFEFTPLGILITVTGLLYLLFVGIRWLPERQTESLSAEYHLREYVTEVVVLPDSPLIGKTLTECAFSTELDLNVLSIIRGNRYILAPRTYETIREGDRLLLEGRVESILKLKAEEGLEIKGEALMSDQDLESEEIKLLEILIPPRSKLIGENLKGLNFRPRYGLTVLAIYRHGETLRDKLSRIRLASGDILLTQGHRDNLLLLRQDPDFMVLGEVEGRSYRKKRAVYALSIFALSLLAGSLQMVPFSIAMLSGAILTILTKCVTLKEAYDSIDWKTLVLVAGLLSAGVAMEKTGTARFLSDQLLSLMGSPKPMLTLLLLFLLTMLLSQPLSNAAAAALVAPIAFNMATQMNVNPRAFMVTVTIAASCSFMTPLEPACLLVYGPGKYTFLDFFKVGFPLTLLVLLVVVMMVPIFWPL